MPEQRLLEEILDTVRWLRENDTRSQIKLAQITAQLESISGIRSQVETNVRLLANIESRIKVVEHQKLDSRLQKVEGTVWKITVGALMVVGALASLDKLLGLVRMVLHL